MTHALFLLLAARGGDLGPFSGSLSAAGFSQPIHLGPITSVDEVPPEVGGARPFSNLLASGSLNFTETGSLAVAFTLTKNTSRWANNVVTSTEVGGDTRTALGFLATLLKARLGPTDPYISPNESFAVSEIRFERHDEKSEQSSILNNTTFREDRSSLQLSGTLRVFEPSPQARKGKRK